MKRDPVKKPQREWLPPQRPIDDYEEALYRKRESLPDVAFQAGQDYIELTRIQAALPLVDKEGAKIRFRACVLIGVTVGLVALGYAMTFSDWPWYARYAPLLGCVVTGTTGFFLMGKALKLHGGAHDIRIRAEELVAKYARKTQT